MSPSQPQSTPSGEYQLSETAQLTVYANRLNMHLADNGNLHCGFKSQENNQRVKFKRCRY